MFGLAYLRRNCVEISLNLAETAEKYPRSGVKAAIHRSCSFELNSSCTNFQIVPSDTEDRFVHAVLQSREEGVVAQHRWGKGHQNRNLDALEERAPLKLVNAHTEFKSPFPQSTCGGDLFLPEVDSVSRYS
jgi:hypothetical protein